MRKYNIRKCSWWDENSIFIEPHQTQKQAVIRDLRSFVFSSSGFGMFFLWNGKVRENCVRLKTTFICKCCFQTNMDISIYCKSLLLVQPSLFGRQNTITRKWEEQMKQLIVENWCSWSHEVLLQNLSFGLPNPSSITGPSS